MDEGHPPSTPLVGDPQTSTPPVTGSLTSIPPDDDDGVDGATTGNPNVNSTPVVIYQHLCIATHAHHL